MVQRHRPFTAQWQVYVTNVIPLKNSIFFPIQFVYISLNIIKALVFMMDMDCVLCDVRTDIFTCCSILQAGHITLSSTPDQQLENHSTKYHRQQPLYNTLGLLMLGTVVPETC